MGPGHPLHDVTERHRDRPEASALPVIARFIVAGMRPPATRGLALAERIRMAVLSQAPRHGDALPPVLLGKHQDGRPLEAGHAHLHVLFETRDAEISHVLLYAPMGFEADVRAGFPELRRIWGPDGLDLTLAWLGTGDPATFGGTRIEQGESPMLAYSRHWTSQTPFVPIRHPKRHRDGRPKLRENGEQIDGYEDQIRMELRRRGWPEPSDVTRVPAWSLGSRTVPWSAFQTVRQHGRGSQAKLAPAGFRLVFPEPVRGPLALGYGCHFGLGSFISDEPAD